MSKQTQTKQFKHESDTELIQIKLSKVYPNNTIYVNPKILWLLKEKRIKKILIEITGAEA